MAMKSRWLSICQFVQADNKGEKSELRIVGRCEGKPLMIPLQRDNELQNVSISLRNHAVIMISMA